MTYHLIVTRDTARRKRGTLISDATEIASVLAGRDSRNVVKVFEHLTHAGVAAAAAAKQPAPQPAPHDETASPATA